MRRLLVLDGVGNLIVVIYFHLCVEKIKKSKAKTITMSYIGYEI
jgi:hypothetical protein